MAKKWTRLLATCLALSLATHAPAQAQPASSSVPVAIVPDEMSGALADGTRWRVQKPVNWNGTIVLDLDGARLPMGASTAPAPPRSPFVEWLLTSGTAYGGITREPVGYDFPKAVDYLLDIRQRTARAWGAPSRTLISGGSRGAFVVRKALELHPDIFDGGLMFSGGGAGEIAGLNNKLNALFVLKTLVDPAAPLALVNIANPKAEMEALQALVDKAKASPQGRARLALAGAVQQFSLWSSRDMPRPAPADYNAMVDQMADNFVWAIAVPVRVGVEKVAGGNVSWNKGVDYAALLGGSGRREMIETLYRQAGLSLSADLRTLARAPRITADPDAVRKAEPLMTYTGRISAPLVNVDNDDPVDPASDKIAYLNTLRHAGTDGLFRLIWTDLPGHGGQRDIDRAVGYDLLIQRIETGQWPDSSVSALHAAASRIAGSSQVDLGTTTIFDLGPLPAPAAEWDARNWGTYQP